MAWILRDKEFHALLETDSRKRYEYCIKRIADTELVWSLASDRGWAVMGDSEEHELVPIWPHERYAAACATDTFADCKPQSIELSTWLEVWTPGMTRDNRLIAVFPTPSRRAPVVTPERLHADLTEYLSEYYDYDAFFENVLGDKWRK